MTVFLECLGLYVFSDTYTLQIPFFFLTENDFKNLKKKLFGRMNLEIICKRQRIFYRF